ncbi:MAG TPA: transcription antitermination factor NusB, partial [Candidatus Acidoferrum sp.]|nr:transcription antitermination factor NusB [Candidatus Acidoferrum sp.]
MTPEKKTAEPQTFDPVRAAAIEALALIEGGAQTESAVADVTRGRNFRPLDIRFLLQLVNGATKMRRRLDHELRFYLARPAMELPPALQNIFRLGFYQILFTDRVPAAAAVSESVNLARRFVEPNQAGLVNAVLRARLREPQKVKFVSQDSNPVKYLGDTYSYPDYFVEYCISEFGFERAEHLLEMYNRAPHVTYRVNFLKAKPDEVAHQLQEAGIEFSYGKFLPEFMHIESAGLPLEDQLLSTGKVFVQDESAGLPIRLL